jgi:hypothetical protein
MESVREGETNALNAVYLSTRFVITDAKQTETLQPTRKTYTPNHTNTFMNHFTYIPLSTPCMKLCRFFLLQDTFGTA